MIAIAATVENAINAALRYDPASRKAVSELTDILAVEVTSTTLPTAMVFCQGTNHGVSIMSHCELPITTRLTGSPTALMGLFNRPHSLANSGVELSGDVKLLQRWQAILDNLDIDWQTCLQQYLGDIAGPITAGVIGKAGDWLQHQWQYHQRQLGVYLQEELRVVPAKAEFDDFHQQVDELVLATDRLQARINNILTTLNQSVPNKAAASDPTATNIPVKKQRN